MTNKLKVITVGNSVGVILSKEILEEFAVLVNWIREKAESI